MKPILTTVDSSGVLNVNTNAFVGFRIPSRWTLILQTSNQDDDETEYQYCLCRTDIGGPMIFCENRNCGQGTWFHLDCLEMNEDDVPDDMWYCCNECKKEAAKRKTKRGRRRTVNRLQDSKHKYVILLMKRALNQKVRRDAIR